MPWWVWVLQVYAAGVLWYVGLVMGIAARGAAPWLRAAPGDLLAAILWPLVVAIVVFKSVRYRVHAFWMSVFKQHG